MASGPAERSWSAAKHLKTDKRAHLSAGSAEQQAAIFYSSVAQIEEARAKREAKEHPAGEFDIAARLPQTPRRAGRCQARMRRFSIEGRPPRLPPRLRRCHGTGGGGEHAPVPRPLGTHVDLAVRVARREMAGKDGRCADVSCGILSIGRRDDPLEIHYSR